MEGNTLVSRDKTRCGHGIFFQPFVEGIALTEFVVSVEKCRALGGQNDPGIVHQRFSVLGCESAAPSHLRAATA
eukprot:scaffold1587_cov157-Cylindrotheca_fusiformis.AAC.3